MKLPEKWKDWYWAAILIAIVVIGVAIYLTWNRAEAQGYQDYGGYRDYTGHGAPFAVPPMFEGGSSPVQPDGSTLHAIPAFPFSHPDNGAWGETPRIRVPKQEPYRYKPYQRYRTWKERQND